METAAEAFPEAAAILADAGWAPHPEWRLYTRDTRVAGITPDGTSLNVKNWAMITPDDPRYGPDTPDTAEEAAGWLVAWHNARAVVMTTDATLDPISLSGMSEAELAPPAEPEQDSAHEGDGETGEEAESCESSVSLVSDDSRTEPACDERAATDGVLERAGALGDRPEWESDADFGATDAEFAEFPPELFATELGQEIAEEHPEEAPPPQDRFFGLDDLDRRRSLRIGDVVRISRAKQAEIAALMSVHDFAAIQSSVVRDTKDGRYIGPQATYDLFVELSRHQSAINRVKAAEADKVAFLEAATRPDLEAFDPEAGWPE